MKKISVSAEDLAVILNTIDQFITLCKEINSILVNTMKTLKEMKISHHRITTGQNIYGQDVSIDPGKTVN